MTTLEEIEKNMINLANIAAKRNDTASLRYIFNETRWEIHQRVLIKAIKHNYVGVLDIYLQDFPTVVYQSWTSLWHAVVDTRRSVMLERLLRFGSSHINERVICTEIFHRAVKTCFQKGIAVIKQFYPQISNNVTPKNENILHICARSRNLRMLRSCIHSVFMDFFTMQSKENQMTPLHIAVQNGFFEIVTLLTTKNPMALNVIDSNGFTPFMMAGKQNQLRILEYFLIHYPDTLDQTNTGGNNIFMHCGNPYVAAMIFEHKPNFLDVNGTDGSNLLHSAVEHENAALVRLCLKYKPELLLQNSPNIQTPLEIAISKNADPECAKALLECKPDLAYVDRLGNTTLHFAIHYCNFELIERIFQSNESNLNCRNYTNATPIHIAACLGRDDVVELFAVHVACDIAVELSIVCNEKCNMYLPLVEFLDDTLKRYIPQDIIHMIRHYLAKPIGFSQESPFEYTT